MLIVLFVIDEVSYDRFHEDADRIHRVAVNTDIPNAPPGRFAVSNWLPTDILLSEHPEVENLTRLAPWNPGVFHENEFFFNNVIFLADSTFFDVFSFPMIKGNPENALRDPFSLVMTEAMEQKYFGSESGLGKTITLSDTLTFTVSGVLSNIPTNSHFSFDFLVSWSAFDRIQLQTNQYTYVTLNENVSPSSFEEKISNLIMDHSGGQLSRSGIHAEPVLQPLTQIYLHSDRNFEIGPTGSILYIYLFLIIAGFILIIACFNFMNLSTARSMERAKEVGIRKVMGSNKWGLVRQFLSESVMIAFLAMFIAIGIVSEVLPFFNDIASKEITFSAILTPAFILGLILLTIITGLLAGSYPAFILSRFLPIEVLKGSFKSTKQGIGLRQGLVISQFAISVVMIIGTIVVLQQLRFMQHHELGFDKEQVAVIDASGIPDQKMELQYQTIKHELRQHPTVKEVSVSNTIPGREAWVAIVTAEGLVDGDSRRMQIVVTDHDFLNTMGIDVVAGRGFSSEFETDATNAVLLNEAAVNNFGWQSPEEALGKYIQFGENERYTIVGITKDYHQKSLRHRIEPTIMRIIPSTFNYVSIRYGRRLHYLKILKVSGKMYFPVILLNISSLMIALISNTRPNSS